MHNIRMPMYDFEDTETGERVELYLAMSEAPRIGSVIERDGRQLRRLPPGQVPGSIIGQYPYESFSIPDGLPGCKPGPRGGNMILSKRHERNVIAAARDLGYPMERR